MQLKRLGCLHNLHAKIFYDSIEYASIEDDHKPFLAYHVPILHLIPTPFPSVWHELNDDANILHYPTIDNLMSIIRVFAAKYLGIA